MTNLAFVFTAAALLARAWSVQAWAPTSSCSPHSARRSALTLTHPHLDPAPASSPRYSSRPALRLWSSPIDLDEGYAKAFRVIDECAKAGESSEDLYDSCRYVDKKAFKFYADPADKEALWDRCHGSWKLQLATGGGKFTTFKPVPIFAYAMIDEHNFGNGVGFNQDGIILSLLGPHYFNAKRRQMGLGINDLFLFSKKLTQWVPEFISEGMGLGKTPEDYKEKGARMPAFTMIAASEKSMIARGGSGGIAIWTRLDKDIRPAAYGVDGN